MNNEHGGWPGRQRGVTATWHVPYTGEIPFLDVCAAVRLQAVSANYRLSLALHNYLYIRIMVCGKLCSTHSDGGNLLPPSLLLYRLRLVPAIVAAIAAITTVRRGPAGWAVAAVPGRGVVRRWLGVGAEGDWAIRVRRRAGLGGGGLGGGRPGRRRTGRGRLGGQRAGQRGLSWGLSWGLNAAVAWCMEGAEEAHARGSAAGSLQAWKSAVGEQRGAVERVRAQACNSAASESFNHKPRLYGHCGTGPCSLPLHAV